MQVNRQWRIACAIHHLAMDGVSRKQAEVNCHRPAG
jgi:hypothetical protein